MKIKAIVVLGVSISAVLSKGAEVKLNDDEVISLSRFEALHKIACEANNSQIFKILFSSRGRNNISKVSREDFQKTVDLYPEVIGINVIQELSKEEYESAVGEAASSRWIDKDEFGVRFFRVEFKLLQNGSAPNFLLLKNGMFYKAVL